MVEKLGGGQKNIHERMVIISEMELIGINKYSRLVDSPLVSPLFHFKSLLFLAEFLAYTTSLYVLMDGQFSLGTQLTKN